MSKHKDDKRGKGKNKIACWAARRISGKADDRLAHDFAFWLFVTRSRVRAYAYAVLAPPELP